MESNIIFNKGTLRVATLQDKPAIDRLVVERSHVSNIVSEENYAKWLYLVYDILNVGVVSCLGVRYSEVINGLELFCGRTDKSYEGKGIMSLLIKSMCSLIDEELYVSGWRVGCKKYANIHNVIVGSGFQLVKSGYSEYYSCCEECTSTVKGKQCCPCFSDGCKCWCDLYKRNIIKTDNYVTIEDRTLSLSIGGVKVAQLEICADEMGIRLCNILYNRLDFGVLLVNRVISVLSPGSTVYVDDIKIVGLENLGGYYIPYTGVKVERELF